MEVETRIGFALGYFDMCGSLMGLHKYWKSLAIKQAKIYCKTARKQEQKQFQLTKSLVKSRNVDLTTKHGFQPKKDLTTKKATKREQPSMGSWI